MLKSKLFEYSNAYVFVKRTITIPNTGTAATSNNRGKKLIFKNCDPFNDCKRVMLNTSM